MPSASVRTATIANAGRASHLTKRVAHVGDARSEPVALSDGGLALSRGGVESSAGVVEVSESSHGFLSRRVRRHARPHEIGDPHREVTFDLEVHLGVDARPSAEAEVEQASIGAGSRHDGRRVMRCGWRATGCRDRFGVAQPGGGLGAQALAAGGRELVVAGAPVVLARAPLGAEPAASFHALQRLIERAVVDAERAVRALLEPGRDGVAVHGAPAERFENEEVERALEEGQCLVGRRHSSYPVSAKGNNGHLSACRQATTTTTICMRLIKMRDPRRPCGRWGAASGGSESIRMIRNQSRLSGRPD